MHPRAYRSTAPVKFVFAGDLLGRHVAAGADRLTVGRQPRAVEIAGQAEVADLHVPVGREKQIGRLQVAVDDALPWA